MNSGQGGKPKGYEWLLAVLSGIGSVVSSKTQLPIKALTGFETPSLLIAFLLGLLGACLGFCRFSKDWLVALVLAAGFVGAMIWYDSLVHLGGLKHHEKVGAVFLYAFLFFSGTYVIAFCERGLGLYFSHRLCGYKWIVVRPYGVRHIRNPDTPLKGRSGSRSRGRDHERPMRSVPSRRLLS